ncbi:hypothetical protein CP967_02535 [Streptomyces nitrosporeus]|uniref:DUF559 domain-containing protein n=1 Tax=Streptomyces nitrosporeus TaxID=28894 RepID=A0A5J6F437_9ACTN|nr:hypothetical protein [Streptomyces nitrosporeus]QEU70981.1 hypothetical protein CP967_02535 [Streptomyces nitrosporeus]
MSEEVCSRVELTDDEVIGAASILLAQRGHTKAAALMLDVTTVRIERHTFEEESMSHSYVRELEEVVLELEPHLIHNTGYLRNDIRSAFETVGMSCGRNIEDVHIREVIPRVGPNWREQLARELKGGHQSNQARKVRLEPRHPSEDGIHLTNEWEHRVYQVLKEHQVRLPSNETIGIMPLGALRVPGHTFEPDFLITYRGRVGVIEVDGPHHKGRASADRSRDRLFKHAGVREVDRLCVEDSTTKEEVQKFVTDFLKHLIG